MSELNPQLEGNCFIHFLYGLKKGGAGGAVKFRRRWEFWFGSEICDSWLLNELDKVGLVSVLVSE
jgi:hypothetical protein